MFVLSGIAVTEGEGKALSTISEQKISLVYYKHLWKSRNVPEQQKSKGQNAWFCLVSAKARVDSERFKCHSETANP